MPNICTFDHRSWSALASAVAAMDLVRALERGDVLFFPALPFAIEPDESTVFSPAILSSAKNASFDPSTGRVRGR